MELRVDDKLIRERNGVFEIVKDEEPRKDITSPHYNNKVIRHRNGVFEIVDFDITSQFVNIVFEGGSSKAYAYISVIEELSNRNLFKNIKRFAGTSIGSLFAVLCATNVSPQIIRQVISTTNFAEILSPEKCLIRKLWNLWRSLGFYSNDNLRDFYKVIFEKCSIPLSLTFEDVYQNYEHELYVVSSNITKQIPIIFNHITHPNLLVIDALVMSSCIPVYYQPFIYNDEKYVDGGLVDNYPLWIFNDVSLLHSGELDKIETHKINPKTLGLKLLDAHEENTYKLFVGEYLTPTLSTYFMGMINAMSHQIERKDISESYIKNTISIKTPEISITDFNLTNDEKKKLEECGKKAVCSFIENYSNY